MGKESRIRQERKAGLVEKPETYHKDRFPVVMRVIAVVLIVALATWGSFLCNQEHYRNDSISSRHRESPPVRYHGARPELYRYV